jgi:tryptophanyl-tRNA synthetase
MTKRVFSGIKPSGSPHLGNYIGAIRNWVADQEKYDNIFCVVDQHAITVQYNPDELRRNLRELVGVFLAAGLDPDKSAVFVQSHVPQHTELAWLLTCVTPMGWLQRMTQFKDKAAGRVDKVGAGLFAYPVLMAADILLYQTHEVPVGDDQKQHVELARDIAQRFNHRFGETFTVPEPVIRQVGARVMGLDDPTSKMSKSDAAPNRCIFLLDEPKRIRKKIARAVTDSDGDIVFDPQRPGVYNLLGIYQALSGQERPAIEAHFAGKGYGDLKRDLSDLVIASLEPLQERYRRLEADPGYLDNILHQSAQRLAPIVDDTMNRVRQAMGLR